MENVPKSTRNGQVTPQRRGELGIARGAWNLMGRGAIVMRNIVTKASEISTTWWKPMRMCTFFLSFVSCGGVHEHRTLLCCVNCVDHVLGD